MKVLLIRPPEPMQAVDLLSHTQPINLAYLAAYLREHGITVGIVDYEVRPYSDEDLRSLLLRERPDLLGVSCMTPSILAGAHICRICKEELTGVPTVVGGPHANGLPIRTLEQFESFDYLVFGEGEVTLLELCQMVRDGGSPTAIDGLVYRLEGRIAQNAPRALIRNLDDLPMPARDLLQSGGRVGHSSRGFSSRLRAVEVFTSRGCPIGCFFCAIQATFGKTLRFRSPLAIDNEIAQVQRSQGVDHVIISDDAFTMQQDRAFELCEVFVRRGLTSWNCNTRVNAITRDLLSSMKASGCEKVSFGVESGSQRIMDRIGKKITVEQVVQAVRWAREVGIKHVEGNFIVGAHPTETMDDIRQTLKMMRNLPFTIVSVTVIVPYPGTPVYDWMVRNNAIDSDVSWEDFVMFGKPPKWRTEHFSAGDLLDIQRMLTRKFFLNPGYIAQRLMDIRSLDELRYWVESGVSYLKWYVRRRC